MQVKCGHQMSSFFYIISAGGQRQQGSALQLLFIHVHKSPSPYPIPKPRLLSRHPPHHHRPKPSPAFSLSAAACVPLSLPQLSDHTSELAFWRLRLNPWINLCVDSEFTNQWFSLKLIIVIVFDVGVPQIKRMSFNLKCRGLFLITF